jgi:dTDP-4-amino-4,6-dideoxygalactose transaminase
MPNVPFFDLAAQHAGLKTEITDALNRVVSGSHLIMGPELEAFENEFAAFCGTAHCVGVASGFDALTLSLRALDIGPGDEVLVPAHTFVATWLAASETGAKPVGVEVDAAYVIDPAAIEAAITPRTRAVIPVHLYGRLADMPAITEIARRHGLAVVEDAAQAHGATGFDGAAGSFGTTGAFSFYPSKNLGALGDGGAITTNDATLAARLRRLRNYGSEKKYVHLEAGVNSRLDELHAAVLRVKLRRLSEANDQRRAIADLYASALAGLPLKIPSARFGSDHVWHVYAVLSPMRDELGTRLGRAGVGTLVHYPVPPHLQEALRELSYKAGDFPLTERICAEELSLPMWPGMTDMHVRRVADAVAEALHEIAR